MSENKRGAKNGAGTKPNAEELWEKAGYLRAAALAACAVAAADASAADAAALATARETDYALAAAYERGKARWKAEHPEARA
jgi:hypothetical protein